MVSIMSKAMSFKMELEKYNSDRYDRVIRKRLPELQYNTGFIFGSTDRANDTWRETRDDNSRDFQAGYADEYADENHRYSE